MRPFARAVAVITAFAATTRAVGFVFRIFLSRVLGAEMLGVYQIAMSFYMVFLTIIASGLPLSISKEVAKATERKNDRDVGKIAMAGLIISLIVSTVLCGAVFLFRGAVAHIFTDERCINILIVLLPSVIACSVYTALRAVWWGEKKFLLLGATELFEQIIRVLFFVILLGFSFAALDTAGLAALSFTIACFVSAGAVLFIYLRQRSKAASSAANRGLQSEGFDTFGQAVKPLVRSAAPITGVRVIGSIAMPLISIIIPARLVAVGWTTSQAIAQFGIVAGMTLPLLTIPGTIISSLATALVPELSGALQKNDTAAVSRQVTGALKFTLFITFLLLPAYMALGDAIGLFLYDNTLSGAYLARSAWVMVPLAMSQITNAILNSLGAETKAMKHYIFGSIALFLTVFFLPPVIGVVALPIGMGLCMLIASVLNLRMIKKLTGANSQIVRLCVWFALISIPSLLVGHFVFGVAGHVWPMVISLPIAGAVSVGSVLLLCRVFNLVDFSNFRLTKNKKKV